MPDIENKYKYAIELVIDKYQRIEERVLSLLIFCEKKHNSLICQLKDIEATGSLGKILTEKLEKQSKYQHLLDEIIEILKDDGQVLELDLILQRDKFSAWIIIRDGQHVNFLSNDTSILDKEQIGDYIHLDLNLFVHNNQGN